MILILSHLLGCSSWDSLSVDPTCGGMSNVSRVCVHVSYSDTYGRKHDEGIGDTVNSTFRKESRPDWETTGRRLGADWEMTGR